MDLTPETAASISYSALHARTESSGRAPESVQLTSRGLGWGALNFERRDYRPASRALPRASDEHLMFVALSVGRVMCHGGGEPAEHQLSPGCVALVPANTPVSWTWATRISVAVLRLQPAFLDQVARTEFGLGPADYRLAPSERTYDAAVANIAGVLTREAMRGERGGKLYSEALASILAVHLLRHYAQCTDGRTLRDCSTQEDTTAGLTQQEAGTGNAAQHRTVSGALEFIHANYARELSLTEIAGAVHVSPFHLARLFKQRLGVSPHRYLVQVRVDNARWLLSAGSGERSLADIASAVGFADQSHLTRHFKRVTGMTPRQFHP